MSWPATISLLLILSLVLGVLGLTSVREAVRRTAELEATGTGGERIDRIAEIRRRLNARMRRTDYGRKLDLKLAGASVARGPADFTLLTAVTAIALVLLLKGFLGYLGSVIIGIAVVASANRWLERRRRKRVEAFIAQLPDLARMLGSAASAGLAMRTGVDLVVRELMPPASEEFAEMQRQIVLGRSLDDAISDLNERLPSRELDVLVRTLIIQSQAGGRLASALNSIAATLEARRELARELKNTISGALFSGYTVLMIGAGSVLIMNAVNPGSLDIMAGSLLGQIVLVVAGTLFLFGFLLIRKITRVDI